MEKLQRSGFMLALLLALCVAAADVFAAEAHHEPRWGDFGWRVLNFVLFVGILWHFAGKRVRDFFTGRRQGIKDTLEGLEERRRDAKARLAGVEERIARLEEERRAILDESRAQAEAVRQSIIDDAQRQAAQIIDQARAAAEREGLSVLAQVRATLADEIVDAAEKILTEKLGPAEHDRLIANSLNKVVLH